MDGKTITALRCGEVLGDVGIEVAFDRRLTDGEKIQHKLGDRAGSGLLGRVDMGLVEGDTDIIAVAMFGAKGIREAAQVKPMAEEMVQHGHAIGPAIL